MLPDFHNKQRARELAWNSEWLSPLQCEGIIHSSEPLQILRASGGSPSRPSLADGRLHAQLGLTRRAHAVWEFSSSAKCHYYTDIKSKIIFSQVLGEHQLPNTCAFTCNRCLSGWWQTSSDPRWGWRCYSGETKPQVAASICVWLCLSVATLIDNNILQGNSENWERPPRWSRSTTNLTYHEMSGGGS